MGNAITRDFNEIFSIRNQKEGLKPSFLIIKC